MPMKEEEAPRREGGKKIRARGYPADVRARPRVQQQRRPFVYICAACELEEKSAEERKG